MNRLFDIPAQQRPLGRHLRQLFLIHTVCAPQLSTTVIVCVDGP
jgi:hypothetical protein